MTKVIMIDQGQDAIAVIHLLERFQTAIVGLVGFAGVIITLVVNASIARRHAREARRHERETLARALAAEISSHARSFKKTVGDMKTAGTETAGLLVPAIRATPVFDANVSHLGRLPGVQIGPVLEAYLTLKEVDRSLPLFSAPDNTGHYRIVRTNHVQHVKLMFESLLPHFETAVAALSGMMGGTSIRPDD